MVVISAVVSVRTRPLQSPDQCPWCSARICCRRSPLLVLLLLLLAVLVLVCVVQPSRLGIIQQIEQHLLERAAARGHLRVRERPRGRALCFLECSGWLCRTIATALGWHAQGTRRGER